LAYGKVYRRLTLSFKRSPSLFGPTFRAMTRDCRPRHKRDGDDANTSRSKSPPSSSSSPLLLPGQLGSLTAAAAATPAEGYLGTALRRFNTRLFGAPWCEKCKQQKQMLYRMLGPVHWRDHYSDCGAATCCLGCTGVKQVPSIFNR